MVHAHGFATHFVQPFSAFPISLFNRIWPVVALGVALAVDAAWVCFLVFVLFTLIF
jgi:hypothetical protein